MTRHFKHPIYGKHTFSFSPICEITHIFDDTLRIQIQITLIELLRQGWVEIE